MTRFTRVDLRGSRGASTIPLTKLFSEAPHKLLLGFNGDTTKPSRRWQPPRVTSTTGSQHDHLVPLDATSRCNRTRIALSHNWMITIKHMRDGGLPSTLKHGHKVPRGAQQPAQARAPPLFIALSEIEPLEQSCWFLRWHQTRRCGHRT